MKEVILFEYFIIAVFTRFFHTNVTAPINFPSTFY